MAVGCVQLLVFGALVSCCYGVNRQPSMRLEKGRVKGNRHSVLEIEVDEYLGIPMAKPPTGPLRFRKPVPVDAWNDTFQATEKPNACWQVKDTGFPGFQGAEQWNPNTNMSEDCLKINVWIPKPDETERKAIMVWIYGGGFYYGSSALSMYDGRYLAASQNVIVVSMNYRMGILGFLALGVEDAPGNMGLFDQLMGLQWTQDNAKHFRGDKNNVTIFGESAGSVSTSLHLISKRSRDLFHRAILQSGSALAKWAIMDSESSWKRVNETVLEKEKIGCEQTTNVHKILKCLRSKDAKFLSEHDWAPDGLIQFNWLPTIDNDFLEESPEQSMKTQNFKKCPIMIGSNANEGSFFIMYEFSSFAKANQSKAIDFKIDRVDFQKYMSEAFRFYPQWDTKLNDFGKEAILYRYTDWRNPDNTTLNRFNLDMSVGDFHFLCPTNLFADYYSRVGELPVYYYFFTHRSTQNKWGEWGGSMHGDEIFYSMGDAVKPENQYTDDEKRLSYHMMSLWGNFAKYGNPNGLNETQFWPKYSLYQKLYYELAIPSLDNAVTASGPRTEYCDFWNHYLPRLVNSTESNDCGVSKSTRPKWAVVPLIFLVLTLLEVRSS